MNCLLSLENSKPFKVITCRVARRLLRAVFGFSYNLICCFYNIPQKWNIQINSLYLFNHLSHPSYRSHLIFKGQRQSHQQDILKIKEGLIHIWFILILQYFMHAWATLWIILIFFNHLNDVILCLPCWNVELIISHLLRVGNSVSSPLWNKIALLYTSRSV